MIRLFKVFVPIGDKRTYTWQELGGLGVQAAFIADLEGRLDLSYLEDRTDPAEVCFANTAEVRPEYRTTFCKMDLVAYIQASLPGPGVDLLEDEVTFPDSAASFFQVKNGS